MAWSGRDAYLRHRRLNSIEALVLSSCKLQILEIPIGGSRDALVLRLWHQLNMGRAITRQLRSAVGEVAAAADQDCTDRLRYGSDLWKPRFATIDLIYALETVYTAWVSTKWRLMLGSTSRMTFPRCCATFTSELLRLRAGRGRWHQTGVI